MRACVSGSSGFVGSHMCAELKSRGYDVDGVDIRPGEHTNIVEDLVDVLRTDKMYAGNRAHYDLFVHAAYHVGGRAMIDGVPDVLSANVELDAALFRWALETRPGRILYFSSSAVYPTWLQRACAHCSNPNCPEGPAVLSEDHTRLDTDRIGIPDARYGWAKLNGEMLVKAARESGLVVTVVRPASGCSANQALTYPFPAIAERVRNKENPLVLWGPEGQSRDFIHIVDVVRGALAVAESGTVDPVNLCNGRATTMGQLAEMMWQEAHGNLDGFNPVYDTTKPTGVFFRVLSPDRMLKYYRPTITLEDMIHESFNRSDG